MRIFYTELQKLFSSRIFLLILAAVFVLNGYLLFRTSKDHPPEQYREIYEVLVDRPDTAKLAWLERVANDFSGQYGYNFTVITELYEECQNVVQYQDFLDNVDAQAKSMSGVSIFAKPDTFNYRSILRTPPAYAHMRDVVPRFDVSRGILLATDNRFTDLLLSLIVLFAVLSLMLSDREQGMSGLLFSTKKGRGTLLLIKLYALALTLFAVTIALYVENLLIGAHLYGLGDLSRPVQSLYGFIGCNLKISTSTYLVCYILFKWGSMLAIGMVLSCIAQGTKGTVGFYSVSATVLLFEGVTYALIQPLSMFSVLHHINLIGFTRGTQLFCNYRNINFFDYPVELIPTAVAAVIMSIILFGSLSVWLYTGRRNLEFHRLLHHAGNHATKVHTPLYYTLYKSLILQKGIVMVLIFIAVAVFQAEQFTKQYDRTDAYYRYYTEQLQGEITEEDFSYCIAESRRFAEIEGQIHQLEMHGASYYQTESLYRQLEPSSGFLKMYNRLQTIADNPDARMFYDTGYLRMLGKSPLEGYDDDMKYALTAMLLCVFLISPLIAGDNRCRMRYLIYASATGKKQYLLRNLGTALLYGTFTALLWMIPYALTVRQYYGADELGAALQSMTAFLEFPLHMNVGCYLLLTGFLRLLAVLFCAVCMLWISAFSRNVTSAVLINAAVFVLPILLYLLGTKSAINIGCNAFLSVNAVMDGCSSVQFMVPVMMLSVLAGMTWKRWKM